MVTRLENDEHPESSSPKPTETSGLAVNTSMMESYDVWLQVEKT